MTWATKIVPFLDTNKVSPVKLMCGSTISTRITTALHTTQDARHSILLARRMRRVCCNQPLALTAGARRGTRDNVSNLLAALEEGVATSHWRWPLALGHDAGRVTLCSRVGAARSVQLADDSSNPASYAIVYSLSRVTCLCCYCFLEAVPENSCSLRHGLPCGSDGRGLSGVEKQRKAVDRPVQGCQTTP
jgi:hypothetical protein